MPSFQYVKVNFEEKRTVYAGGNALGETNCTLRVNSGTHTFDLGDPRDYTPDSIRRKVANTSVSNPMQLAFFKK